MAGIPPLRNTEASPQARSPYEHSLLGTDLFRPSPQCDTSTSDIAELLPRHPRILLVSISRSRLTRHLKSPHDSRGRGAQGKSSRLHVKYPRTTISIFYRSAASCFRKNDAAQKQEVVAPHFIRSGSMIGPRLRQSRPPLPGFYKKSFPLPPRLRPEGSH